MITAEQITDLPRVGFRRLWGESQRRNSLSPERLVSRGATHQAGIPNFLFWEPGFSADTSYIELTPELNARIPECCGETFSYSLPSEKGGEKEVEMLIIERFPKEVIAVPARCIDMSA